MAYFFCLCNNGKLEKNTPIFYTYSYSKFLSRLKSVRVLILDDIGLKMYSLEESRDILEIAEVRYNKVSTILVGQVSHTKLYKLFQYTTILI